VDHRKYKNGGVGILTHLAVLQGTNYSCEFEIYCDGYLLKSVPSSSTFASPPINDALRLFDPYNCPVVHVRRPGSDKVEEYKFRDDDPFLTEMSEFVDVIEHGKQVENLLSTFEGMYGIVDSLIWFVMMPMLDLPAVRCMQDI
jgi:Putative oxidoreductase C terminal domain